MQNVEQNSRFGATFGRTTLPHWLHAPFFNAFRNSAMHNSEQNSLSPFGVGSTYFNTDLFSLHQAHVTLLATVDDAAELLLGALDTVDDNGDEAFFDGRPGPRCFPLLESLSPFDIRALSSLCPVAIRSELEANVVVTATLASCLVLSTASLAVDGAGDVFFSSDSVIEAISSCDFIGVTAVAAGAIAAISIDDADLLAAELVLTF